MILEQIDKVRENAVVKKVLSFFDGNLYPLIYAFLTLVCSFTGVELVFYALTAIVVVFTTIFCRNTNSLMAPLVMAVYAVSQRHTPQPPYNSDYLYRPYVLGTLGGLFALVFAAFLFRLIAYKGSANVFCPFLYRRKL